MTKFVTFLVLIVVFALLVPHASADFTKTPIFDLKTDRTVYGVFDSIYTFYLENPDPSEDIASVSITIPIGYYSDSGFFTNETGIIVMTGYASHPQLGKMPFNVVTTTTLGRFLINATGATLGEITITEPSSTTTGRMEIKFSGVIAVMNHGCSVEFNTNSIINFATLFTNPWTPAIYAWAPAIATSTSGKSVTMEPRPGHEQNVQITVPEMGWRSLANTTSLVTTEIQSSTITDEIPATRSLTILTIIGTTSRSLTSKTTIAPPPSQGNLGFTFLLLAMPLLLVPAVAATIMWQKRRS